MLELNSCEACEVFSSSNVLNPQNQRYEYNDRRIRKCKRECDITWCWCHGTEIGLSVRRFEFFFMIIEITLRNVVCVTNVSFNTQHPCTSSKIQRQRKNVSFDTQHPHTSSNTLNINVQTTSVRSTTILSIGNYEKCGVEKETVTCDASNVSGESRKSHGGDS